MQTNKNEQTYIRVVKDRLKELGYKPMDDDYYQNIYTWLEWYKGYVPKFHEYRMFNGMKFLDLTLASMGLPKTFAERWASLLYNDNTAISMAEEDKAAQEALDDALKETNFEEQFANTLELAFALGTAATVVFRKADGKAGVNHIYAPMIFPLRMENKEIVDCAFASVESESDYYLNIHEKQPDGSYKITNDFFECKNGGSKTPVQREDIAPESYSEVKMFQIYRPNIVNKMSLFSPFGMSFYANCIDQFKTADYAYDALQNEFRLGKKKVFVPVGTLTYKTMVGVDGKTAEIPIFDENQTEYYMLPGSSADDVENTIQEYNPSLRISELLDGIQLAINLAGMNAGFGENYFTFRDGKVYTNTTQVVSSNSELYKNILKHEKMLRHGLIELARAIYYTAVGKVYEGDITVDFDDSVVEDSEAKKNQAILELNNDLIDPVQYYQDVYGMTEQQAIDFREKIKGRKEEEQPEEKGPPGLEDEDENEPEKQEEKEEPEEEE